MNKKWTYCKPQAKMLNVFDSQPVGVDVVRVLGYKDPSSDVRNLVSPKNKGLGKLPGIRYGENKPRIEEIMLLKEAGIYQLIFGYNLP